VLNGIAGCFADGQNDVVDLRARYAEALEEFANDAAQARSALYAGGQNDIDPGRI
jgi:hypothetical protein